MLTGSYHNYFRIYDAHGPGEVVLQADKSAFKAKKIGTAATKTGLKNGGLRKDNLNLDSIDFNKKILHASWHPRENTIAVSGVSKPPAMALMFPSFQIAATNNLFLYSAAT